MELDRFLITKDPPGLSEDSSHMDEWCRKWSRPVNLALFDTVNLTEQECSDMLKLFFTELRVRNKKEKELRRAQAQPDSPCKT